MCGNDPAGNRYVLLNKIMTKIKACIFDLDGVLVDTASYHYLAWKKLANQLGFDFTEKENERLKGINRLASLNLILEWGGVTVAADSLAQLADKKNAWYTEMIENMTDENLLPGTKDFLQTLIKSGYKVALGSASKNARLILDKTKVAGYFDAIVDGTSVSESKPDPTVFLEGAKLLGVDPKNCVVFEDAVSGIEAAKQAGMKVIGVGSPEVLIHADLVISGLDKIKIEDIQFL